MSTVTTPTCPRAATIDEITAAGWLVDGEHIQSPDTHAWYPLAAMRVAEYRTDPATGERERGPWLYLDDEGPCAERFIARLDPRALYDAAAAALAAADEAGDDDMSQHAAVQRDAAATLMIAHDTPRPWRLIEEGYHYDTISAGSATAALAAARRRVDRDNYSGDDVDPNATLYIDIRVQCDETGERESSTVTLEPDEPDCVDGLDHEWCSPISLVGGCRENPGVHGHGGGVIIDEVCRHCGIYRTIDTWAQRRDTGEQGLEETSYREADDASVDWLLQRMIAAVAEIADVQVRGRFGCIVNYAPDSSAPEYGGETGPGSAWYGECDRRLAEVRAALPPGWEADWSDDDIHITRVD